MYGLSSTGKKPALADRIFNHLHPNDDDSASSSTDNVDVSDKNEDFAPTGQQSVLPSPVSLPIEELRALIRKEIASFSTYRPSLQPTVSAGPQLSPASLGIPAPGDPPLNSMPPPPLCSSIPPVTADPTAPVLAITPGNYLSTFTNNKSFLPAVSRKIMLAFQNKEYIDFNSLLRQALYDIQNQSSSFSLKFDPSSQELVSSPTNKSKINSAASWLQAWNIYTKGTLTFFPELALQILYYQEFICNLQRNYPVTSW